MSKQLCRVVEQNRKTINLCAKKIATFTMTLSQMLRNHWDVLGKIKTHGMHFAVVCFDVEHRLTAFLSACLPACPFYLYRRALNVQHQNCFITCSYHYHVSHSHLFLLSLSLSVCICLIHFTCHASPHPSFRNQPRPICAHGICN